VWLHAGIVWLLMIALVVQVFLAGLGAFGGGFGPHLSFAWLIALLILLLAIASVIASLAGALPWTRTGLTGVLVVLWIIQLFLAHTGVPAISALHALNALVMLGVGGYLAGRARMMVAAGGVEALRTEQRSPIT
jgi:hypothetical protein